VRSLRDEEPKETREEDCIVDYRDIWDGLFSDHFGSFDDESEDLFCLSSPWDMILFFLHEPQVMSSRNHKSKLYILDSIRAVFEPSRRISQPNHPSVYIQMHDNMDDETINITSIVIYLNSHNFACRKQEFLCMYDV
jgi:hypothetical protein